MGYPINPAKIDKPRISRKALFMIECVESQGIDVSTIDDMLSLLDHDRMTEYATFTTCLTRSGHNFDDWLLKLDDSISWLVRSNGYLLDPRPEITSLEAWVADEIVLEMICATIHPCARPLIDLSRNAHEALEWVRWYCNRESKCSLVFQNFKSKN
jgi:hypothetical protein